VTQSSTTSPAFLEIDGEPKFLWEDWMSAEQFIGPNTRLRTRPRLNAARWSGNIDAACRVAAVLADNAAKHGKAFYGNRIWLRLICLDESDDLVIEVDDADPDFPHFDEVATTAAVDGKPTGLWWVPHYHGRLSWRVKRNDADEAVGKTVQVVLPSAWPVE
jgi:hypothetical protein